MTWQGPTPRALTMSLSGEHLSILEQLQRELLTRGQDLTLADVVRDLVRAYGPTWMAELRGDA